MSACLLDAKGCTQRLPSLSCARPALSLVVVVVSLGLGAERARAQKTAVYGGGFSNASHAGLGNKGASMRHPQLGNEFGQSHLSGHGFGNGVDVHTSLLSRLESSQSHLFAKLKHQTGAKTQRRPESAASPKTGNDLRTRVPSWQTSAPRVHTYRSEARRRQSLDSAETAERYVARDGGLRRESSAADKPSDRSPWWAQVRN